MIFAFAAFFCWPAPGKRLTEVSQICVKVKGEKLKDTEFSRNA